MQKATEHFVQNPVVFLPTQKAGAMGSPAGRVEPRAAPGFKDASPHISAEWDKSPHIPGGRVLFSENKAP